MTQQLRAHTIFAEDPVSVPSTRYGAAHSRLLLSAAPKEPNTFFWTLGYLYNPHTYTYTQIYTYTHIFLHTDTHFKKKKVFKNPSAIWDMDKRNDFISY